MQFGEQPELTIPIHESRGGTDLMSLHRERFSAFHRGADAQTASVRGRQIICV